MTKGEEDFIEQFARTLLLQWCVQTLEGGAIINRADAGGYCVPVKTAEMCFQHGLTIGWIGKSLPPKVTAKGFATAASFLRR